MKHGARLTLYFSLIIILILSGYGYFHVYSCREVLTRMMKLEVTSLAETLKVALERISLPRDMIHAQELLDAISGPAWTLGVNFCHQGRNLVFRSRSLEGGLVPFFDLIQSSIRENRGWEQFGTYQGIPVFSYAFSIK